MKVVVMLAREHLAAACCWMPQAMTPVLEHGRPQACVSLQNLLLVRTLLADRVTARSDVPHGWLAGRLSVCSPQLGG